MWWTYSCYAFGDKINPLTSNVKIGRIVGCGLVILLEQFVHGLVVWLDVEIRWLCVGRMVVLYWSRTVCRVMVEYYEWS